MRDGTPCYVLVSSIRRVFNTCIIDSEFGCHSNKNEPAWQCNLPETRTIRIMISKKRLLGAARNAVNFLDNKNYFLCKFTRGVCSRLGLLNLKHLISRHYMLGTYTKILRTPTIGIFCSKFSMPLYYC